MMKILKLLVLILLKIIRGISEPIWWKYIKQSKLKSNAKKGNTLKIVLLHNASDFEDFDGDENILVFSGHIHGGHVGLCFGITNVTLVSRQIIVSNDI